MINGLKKCECHRELPLQFGSPEAELASDVTLSSDLDDATRSLRLSFLLTFKQKAEVGCGVCRSLQAERERQILESHRE